MITRKAAVITARLLLKRGKSIGGRSENSMKGGIIMPYVNIKITNEGATTEQKAALIKGATQLLVDVLGKNPATTVVIIDEVETDNWGIAGESVAMRRKARK
jgi:4-oxalocrotonate tautomerase